MGHYKLLAWQHTEYELIQLLDADLLAGRAGTDPSRGRSAETRRGAAAGCDVDRPWRRVAAPPRGATWIVHGDETRHRRGMPRG